MTIATGRLDHCIDIEQPDSGIDDFGAPLAGWTVFAQAWAAIEPLNGREFFQAQAEQTKVTTRFRLHYIPGITTAMRIKYGDRTWDIRSVIDPNDLGAELVIMADELLP